MSTYRQAISDVRGTHRLLSSDAQINDRTIARELRVNSLLLIKRETDKGKLFSSPNLFTVLPCLEFEEVPLAQCCDYSSPKTIAKSKKKIPKIAEGIYGLMIQRVSGVDNRVSFKESTPFRYANILKLKLPNKDIYYWVYNDHLWITDPDIKKANLSALFEVDLPQDLLYPDDCECREQPVKCYNPLDEPFRCPGYLEQAVKELVSKKLLETYFRLPVDRAEDDSDEQTK